MRTGRCLGAGAALLLGLASSVHSEFAPVSYIPQELVQYFHPWVGEEAAVLPGVVERRRRALEEEEPGAEDAELGLAAAEYEDVYKISRQRSDPKSGMVTEELCMLIRVSATFTINFEARPPSPVQVDTKTVDLPAVPDSVNGTCILETEKAKIFIFWSGYNFTLEFIKNPEGNSYYMNRALLQYNTKHPDLAKDFQYAATTGTVTLQTMPGLNFFFTPLGKSFVCRLPEDQGPMKLYNVARNEIAGSLEMRDTKFQPFVVRAGGRWGGEKPCLDADIRKARLDFWPFVSAGLLLLSSGAFFGGYAAKRTWFTAQKVDYGSYEEGNMKMQHEMELVRQQQAGPPDTAAYTEVSLAQEPPQPPAQAQAANPFQQKSANPFQAASNPFNN